MPLMHEYTPMFLEASKSQVNIYFVYVCIYVCIHDEWMDGRTDEGMNICIMYVFMYI